MNPRIVKPEIFVATSPSELNDRIVSDIFENRNDLESLQSPFVVVVKVCEKNDGGFISRHYGWVGEVDFFTPNMIVRADGGVKLLREGHPWSESKADIRVSFDSRPSLININGGRCTKSIFSSFFNPNESIDGVAYPLFFSGNDNSEDIRRRIAETFVYLVAWESKYGDQARVGDISGLSSLLSSDSFEEKLAFVLRDFLATAERSSHLEVVEE
ncbi:MAG: hypothetical protein UT34_C0001G0400 [candidate division WS6 bacterium GW2011_GWF2_39_15]|uniref:Uncharacterized protein n=1 Tax=candidate division WS6 bacterium GW2011_GWF2_39_15 TaxID=1619100 RepID=A0A0G0Q7E5_9BACT|nr:MAG: hypothetical protein UT34_C0001G0400 [candidate division WS6 bacterium GW2011_GWF2_39_15]